MTCLHHLHHLKFSLYLHNLLFKRNLNLCPHQAMFVNTWKVMTLWITLDSLKCTWWRINLVPKLVQVQASDYNFGNEVIVSSSFLPVEPISHINLTIAIRKGTRECTKHPLYPFLHFVFFEKCSPSHRNFLIRLNTIFLAHYLRLYLVKIGNCYEC